MINREGRSLTESIRNIGLDHIRNIFGQFDSFAKKIEGQYDVSIVLRDGEIRKYEACGTGYQ